MDRDAAQGIKGEFVGNRDRVAGQGDGVEAGWLAVAVGDGERASDLALGRVEPQGVAPRVSPDVAVERCPQREVDQAPEGAALSECGLLVSLTCAFAMC